MPDEVYSLTLREYDTVVDIIRDHAGGRLLNQPVRRRKITPMGRRLTSTSAGIVRRAKAQENAQANGLLSVKLLGTDGAVTGDAFDIFAFTDGSATDFTALYFLAETGAVIASGNDLQVFKDIDNDWYLASTLIKVTTAQLLGGGDVNDIIDLSGGNLRAGVRVITVLAKAAASKEDQIETTDCS